MKKQSKKINEQKLITELEEKLKTDTEVRNLFLAVFRGLKFIDQRCGWNKPSFCGNCNLQHAAERIEAASIVLKSYKKNFMKQNRSFL